LRKKHTATRMVLISYPACCTADCWE